MDMSQYPRQFPSISLNRLINIRKIPDPCLEKNELPIKTVATLTLTAHCLMRIQIPTKTVATIMLATFLSNSC